MPGSTPKSSKLCIVPMSERQQLKLVRQLEVSDNQIGDLGNVSEGTPPRRRPRSCNGRGETPLHRAAIKGDNETVAKLLSEGADPNVPDFAGWTPLHEACNHGWYGVASLLLESGASVNARGFEDDTPLHDAAVNGHSKLVRLLVEKGADVHFRNKRGKTPCDVAAPDLVPHILTVSSGVDTANTQSKVNLKSGQERDDNGGDEATATSEERRLPTVQDKGVENSPVLKFKLREIKKKRGKLNFDDIKYPSALKLYAMEDKNVKEDIYEFKSSKEATPVRGNSASPEVDKTVSETKSEKTGDGFSLGETESPSSKRSLCEVGDGEEIEDEVKKKKRKDGEGKEATGPLKAAAGSVGRGAGIRANNGGGEKIQKTGSHIFGKNSGAASKTTLGGSSSSSSLTVSSVSSSVSSSSTTSSSSSSLTCNATPERKSPASPKGSATPAASASAGSSGKSELEQEDKLAGDGEKTDPGPKVPPLKIVIPQQSGNEPEQGNRNGKSNALRHHQALPYVVSSNGNDGEKEGTRSRSSSPGDPFKSDEKKDPAIGMLSAEDQKGSLHHQRVLRSSHRSGPGGNGDSRPPDPSAPRSSNGNGPAATSSASAGPATTASNTLGTNSAGSTSSTENSSPQSQRGTSPSPQAEVSSCGTGTCISSTSEGSTPASASSNHRSNPSASNKPNGSSSNPTSGGVSEEKTPESNAESGQNQPNVPTSTPAQVELHPRKRKLKHNKEVKEASLPPVSTERCESTTASTEVHPHEQPVKNSYQLFLDIRKQIERRRKGLFPVQPKPPQGFKDYLMNRCTYVLAGNASTRQIPSSPLPQNLTSPMKDLFVEQEKERHRLRLQHVIEKEKLVLSVEQEILRVHGRAARILANQSLPFSACTILKDEEVYNFITPEQEEKDRNARPRYNGRLFLSWLQDVDDKWEKIKEAMLLRHHNEAESLHAVQKMDWEWKMKELGSCEFKSKPVILDSQVPMVHVSDDFDLLPA